MKEPRLMRMKASDDADFFSNRDALRVAEDTWTSDNSDVQLLELYALFKGNEEPDEDVLDEIAAEVGDLLFQRIKKDHPSRNSTCMHHVLIIRMMASKHCAQ